MVDVKARGARIDPTPRVGPYENWMFGPVGARYAGADARAFKEIACLAEIRYGPQVTSVGAAFERVVKVDRLSVGDLRRFRLPTVWSPAFETPSLSGARIAPVVAAFRPVVHDVPPPPPLPEIGYRLNAPLRRGALDPGFVQAPAKLAPSRGLKKALAARKSRRAVGAPLALLAVIDDGLAFAHPHLRDAAGHSRVESVWLQGAPAGTGAIAGRVLFGREWRGPEIDALVAAHGDDARGVYAEAGSLAVGSGRWSPLSQTATHGSLVLDIAAGHRHGAGAPARPVPGDGDLDRVRVIGVELPPAAVLDTTGFGLEAYALAAFHFVFDRADAIAAAYGIDPDAMPLAINFSFGVTGGPQDGQDRLEEAIEHLIETRRARGAPTVLAMPSGNSFIAGLHGRVEPAQAAGGRAQALWRVQPCDRTSNYLEIWYPPAVAQPSSLEIVLPDGTALAPIAFPALPIGGGSASQALVDLVVGGVVVGQVSLDFFRGYRWRVMVILAPTQTRDATLAAAPAGVWTVRADATPIQGGHVPIEFRIQRDERVQNPWVGALQGRFDDPRDRSFGSGGAPAQTDRNAVFTRRFGAINGFATHRAVCVVGGRDAATGAPALYSSAGDVRATPPDASTRGYVATSAPSDDSPALRGQRAAGLAGGAVARLVGVSAASPQLAREIAIAWLDGASPPPPPPVSYQPATDLERCARLGF